MKTIAKTILVTVTLVAIAAIFTPNFGEKALDVGSKLVMTVVK